ncbi:MAG: ABC transporter permease [Actinomycetota bacterium]|nr:ABC transporter permease [Actinomycetota bacterium]MDQ6946184.1 ABC transporter permease [Actinomycetota bacterium]
MTTVTTSPPGSPRVLPRRDAPLLPDVLRSEWTKLRSVRSTYWSLLVAAGATIGLSALICTVYVNRYDTLSPRDRLDFNPTSFSLNGLFLAQLAIAVLGVLVITSEFSTGMIRSTFAAVPQRRSVLAAKATVFGAVTLVVGLASCFAAFFLGQSILASKHIQAHLGDPGVLRSVTGAALYLAVLGLLSLGIGALIRHSAGAIAAVFGLIFVLPGLVTALPASWDQTISPYLPSNAGEAMFRMARGGNTLLSPWVGFAVFCLYAAVALGAAAVTIVRRDP